MLKLFHGSNVEIEKVDLSKCMPNKDFGCGFYTTLLEHQAWRMAQRRVQIAGGIPTVTVFDVPDDLVEKNDLNCRVFESNPTIERAIFIRNNRDRKFSDISSSECGRLTNQYTFHTEKALKYLKKAGVLYDKSTAGND